MHIFDLVNKRIGLLGLGREGSATLAALRRHGHEEEVFAFVDASPDAPEGVTLLTTPDLMASMDAIIRSPGFPPTSALRQAADASGVRQVTATQLFLREMRDKGFTVIGITASKGKSTTSTLTQLILREAGVDVVLVGNIGIPALDIIYDIFERHPVVVMELSSYQCADIEEEYAPPIAMLGALFPEHLDYHGSTAAYYRAKARIAVHQKSGDTFFCHRMSTWALTGQITPGTPRLLHEPDGLHYAGGYFRRGTEILFSGKEMRMLGNHNRDNAVAALSIAEMFGATPAHLHTVVSTFAGLPYRLQDEGIHGGFRWINDSISTASESAIMALNAIGQQAQTLVVGGFDRGHDMQNLAEFISNSDLDHVIVLPTTGHRIARNLRARKNDVKLYEVESLAEAVKVAKRVTTPGMACVFSPGAPSYTFFKNFEERGAEFRRQVLLNE